MKKDVNALLNEADHVLIAFDGPLCTVFDPSTARSTAERLRILLDPKLPRAVAGTGDPFEVLRYAETCGEHTAYVVERQLSRFETDAITRRVPTEGAIDAVRTLFATGHTVTAIGNVSSDAIRSYLGLHGLMAEIRRISARGSFRTTKLLPDPFLLAEAVESLGTRPERCLFVSASARDAEASRAIGIPVLGYGGAVPRRRTAGTIESMAELASTVDPLSWIGR